MRDQTALRHEICGLGARLYQRGHVVGHAGNISVRFGDGWLITPEHACLGDVQPLDIAYVDGRGKHLSGALPSAMLSVHRAIYARNWATQAVLHTQSTHLVQLSLCGVWRADDVLPPLTPAYVLEVGHIPLLAYRLAGDPALAEQVGALAEQVRGVLLQRVGPLMWGASLAQAAHALETLEQSARLWHLSSRDAVPLKQEALDELKHRCKAVW